MHAQKLNEFFMDIFYIYNYIYQLLKLYYTWEIYINEVRIYAAIIAILNGTCVCK